MIFREVKHFPDYIAMKCHDSNLKCLTEPLAKFIASPSAWSRGRMCGWDKFGSVWRNAENWEGEFQSDGLFSEAGIESHELKMPEDRCTSGRMPSHATAFFPSEWSGSKKFSEYTT